MHRITRGKHQLPIEVAEMRWGNGRFLLLRSKLLNQCFEVNSAYAHNLRLSKALLIKS
jgi:hypothetical protein